MELGLENPHFGPTKYPKMQYFTNNGPETPQNWYKPYISMFLQIIRIFWYYLYTTISKWYEARARKSPFWTSKLPKMQYFTNNGPETPQNWCKPYISMFLQLNRIPWYYLYTTIPKSYGSMSRKSPCWAPILSQNAIFHK